MLMSTTAHRSNRPVFEKMYAQLLEDMRAGKVTPEQIAALDAQEASWQANNDQISDWLEDHVKTSIAVHDLIASVAALEDRVTAQAARIRALEAAAGITSA